MTQKVITLFVFLIVIVLSQNSYSQLNSFDCQLISPPAGANNSMGTPYAGKYKPTRTNVSSDPLAAFPILVVFVQFKDEDALPRDIWPKNGPPNFLGNLIAQYKSTASGNFWEKYNPNTQMISSRWAEISRGTFHVISPQGAFSVVLPKTAQQYWDDANENHTVCEQAINRDIWASVISQGLTDWSEYDRWKKVGNDFVFCDPYEGDGVVDMIYKVHKSVGHVIDSQHNDQTVLYNAAGYNCLGIYNTVRDEVDEYNHISGLPPIFCTSRIT